KPYASCAGAGPEVARGPQAAVLVIDDSFATGLVWDGRPIIEHAHDQARRILAQLGPEADVAILRSAEDAPAATELSRDHLRLNDAIGAIRPSARPPDTWTALRRAGQLLAASNHERRTVFLISLMAERGFDHAGDAPWPAATGPELVPVALIPDTRPGNLAVTGVKVERDPSSGSHGVRVVAELSNFSDQAVRDRGVALRVGERVVARGQVTLGPDERQIKQLLATLPEGARVADVVVELDPDALVADDRRYVRAELREEVRVLLVNGDPHAIRYDDELFYVEAALRPGDRADSGAVLTTITVDDLPEAEFDDFDVVVLANVRALRAPVVARLQRWAEAGGGLFISAGDNVDADAYAKSMHPLLPQHLRSTLDASYGARGAERAERALRLTKWDPEHPIFAVFSRDAPGLREARFDRVILLGPTTRVRDRKVLARYTNGAVALVEGRIGDGRVLLFTSTVDRDWADLSIQPGYLPLMQQAIRYLARKQDRRRRDEVLVGRTAVVPVKSDDRRVEVRGPGGSVAVFEGEALSGRRQLRFDQTDRPGLYRVWATDAGGRLSQRHELDFAVNLDPRGSDLSPRSLERLPAGGQDEVRRPPEQQKRRVELWHALAAGLIILLLAESLLMLR
ncbi:hypothetical protein, partial [Haliangium sp.]|uniref:hypothetical protein n=1 Tax=Haliangium sp. TaxID=2663208 RepID=UPI003D0C1E62